MARDYYEILGLGPRAKALDIKKAFRVKIKSLHPDTRNPGQISSYSIHDLLEAYEVLSNPDQKAAYDSIYLSSSSDFNYREFLQARQDDKSQGKLVFYDLLRKREKEAVRLYGHLTKTRAFDLEKSLGKEDFMDCAFLLALEMEKAGDLAQAVHLYLRISRLEKEKAYFRHFFVEVLERLKHLFVQKITWEIPGKELLFMIEEILTFDLGNKNRLALEKKSIKLYMHLDQLEMAFEKLKRTQEAFPKDAGLKKLAKELSQYQVNK